METLDSLLDSLRTHPIGGSLMNYPLAAAAIALVFILIVYVFFVFSPNPLVCNFPSNLSCPQSSLSASGQMSLNIVNLENQTIDITGVGCNSGRSYINVDRESVELRAGGVGTFQIQCYNGHGSFSASPGVAVTGYIILNYTYETNNTNVILYAQFSGKPS